MSNDLYLVYAGKPTYGGWVSFTSHLSKVAQAKGIYRFSKRSEKRTRPYGYECSYQNTTVADFIERLKASTLPPVVLITAVDHHYYPSIQNLVESLNTITNPTSSTTTLTTTPIPLKVCIVIHDPTEVAGKKAKVFVNLLETYRSNINLLTIRPRVYTHLKTQYNLESTLCYHPFHLFNDSLPSSTPASTPASTPDTPNHRAVSIARIDHDKHTDIIVQANKMLPSHLRVALYGAINGFYAYKRLHAYDTMKRDDPDSNYHGTFSKDWQTVTDIVNPYNYVVDLSIIKGDGGHTQYTFLEAIYLGKVLILHHSWISGPDSIWIENENCLAVSTPEQLVQKLTHPLSLEAYKKIVANSQKILDKCLQYDWVKIGEKFLNFF